MITTVFTTILAIFKAIPIIESLFNQFVAFYMNQQTNQTLSLIVDAAAKSARAKNDVERYAAAQSWITALSRPRVL